MWWCKRTVYCVLYTNIMVTVADIYVTTLLSLRLTIVLLQSTNQEMNILLAQCSCTTSHLRYIANTEYQVSEMVYSIAWQWMSGFHVMIWSLNISLPKANDRRILKCSFLHQMQRQKAFHCIQCHPFEFTSSFHSWWAFCWKNSNRAMSPGRPSNKRKSFILVFSSLLVNHTATECLLFKI